MIAWRSWLGPEVVALDRPTPLGASRSDPPLATTRRRVLERRREIGEIVVRVARSIAGAVSTAFSLPPPRRSRWLRAVIVVADVVLAVVVVAVTTSSLMDRDIGLQPMFGPLTTLVGGFALGVPVLLRDRAPLAAWRLTVGVSVISAGVFAPLLPVGLLPTHLIVALITSYTAVLRSDRPIGIGVWYVTATGVAIVGGAVGPPAMDAAGWVVILLLLTAPIVLGHNVRARRITQTALVDQRRRAEQAREGQAVLEERARIARELHDVVAHHMTVVAIQAEAAPLRHPGDAAALTGELASIRQTALTALTETRRILGVLRDAGASSAPEPPAPGIAGIAGLVEVARAAGHPVTVEVTVHDGEVSPGLALSIHRLVQESISNVLRHAPSAPIAVAVRRRVGEGIEVSVVNRPVPAVAPDGPVPMVASDGWAADAGAVAGDGVGTEPGHGQIGMRERVAMLDGRLEVGPTPDGGYAVWALLPEGRP